MAGCIDALCICPSFASGWRTIVFLVSARGKAGAMKRRDTEENREYWRSVEEIAEEVRSTFPLWKLPEDVAKDWSEYRANKKPADEDGPV